MRKAMLQVVELVDPVPPPYRRFRILETYISIDGYRTRVCNEAYATLEEAVAATKDTRDDKDASGNGSGPAQSGQDADAARPVI